MKDKKLFSDCELDLILLSDDIITTSNMTTSGNRDESDDKDAGPDGGEY
jgi:hypothetical protein